MITFNNIRISRIKEEIIRIEKYRLSNKNTLFIPTKENFKDLDLNYLEQKNRIVINYLTYQIHVLKNKDLIYIKENNKIINKFNFNKTNGELPLPINTPLFFHINDNPKIEYNKEGYTTKEVGNHIVFENSYDMYIIFCAKDAIKLRKLYTFLTKPSEFVRLSTLGAFDSRYYPYYDKEALSLIDKFSELNLPLDNFVIDTDRRKAKDRGIGYEINTTYFPNLENFFVECHKRNIEIMFNDHPEPINNTKDIFDEEEIKYRETNLKHILSLGLDYWWYDRNWITSLISPLKDLRCETLGMYAFYEITKDYFSSKNDYKYPRRPLIMGNVVNIVNGEYKAIDDIASHRYSIQWSGDILSSMSSLATEVKNMVKCSLNCMSYYSSDLGGHIGDPNKYEYIRWIQLGTFQPIFRPHCTCSVNRFREPFNYDKETVNIYRNYLNLRYRLLPFIYKNAYETYTDGLPFIRALSLNYPLDKKANKNYSSFMIGNKLLVSPIIEGEPTFPLLKENYIGKVKAKFYNNIKLEGNPVLETYLDTLDFEFNGTSIFKNVNPYDFTAEFEFKLIFKEDVTLFAAIDDGSIFYIDDKEIYSDWNYHGAAQTKIIELNKNIIYNFKLKYLQGGGEAKIKLFKQKRKKQHLTKVYLPSSEWFSLFDGLYFKESTTLTYKNTYEFLPLFIKCGSIIPLIKEANNTNKLNWETFIFDYYPSKTATDHDYLYEDDHKTIGYQFNESRITNYSIFFNKKSNSYVFNLDASIGKFNDSEKLNTRNIIFKFENIFNEEISTVLLNDQKINYVTHPQNNTLFPLCFNKESRTNKVVTIEFIEDLTKNYKLEIFIK